MEFTVNLRLTLAALGIAASCALPAKAQILNVGDIMVQPDSPRVNDTLRILTVPTTEGHTP